MTTVFIILHILICFLIIGVVLLQAGKGAEIGAAFGGSSQTLFGSRGAGTFLSKVTTGAAILFMVTSLVLSMNPGDSSVISTIDIPPADEVPTEGSVADTPFFPLEQDPQEEMPAPVEGMEFPPPDSDTP